MTHWPLADSPVPLNGKAPRTSGIRILAVDDDPRMQQLLKMQLSARGYAVVFAACGTEALTAIADDEPDIVLLDIEMPGMDGMEVCRRVRDWSSVPIILVTSTDETARKVEALECGADDYVTKPYHVGELVARITAVLRRTNAKSSTPAQIRLGETTVDMARRVVARNGEPVHLTRIEFEILCKLVANPDRVLTYDDLLVAIWGPGYYDVRPLHVHICKLRRKLEPEARESHIVAIPGVGYRFDPR